MGLRFRAEHKILGEKAGATRILQAWPYISEKFLEEDSRKPSTFNGGNIGRLSASV
jgi:hypothetical protein